VAGPLEQIVPHALRNDKRTGSCRPLTGTGAQTVTVAMAALQERSGSAVPVLGYMPAYPLSNILLTTWGSVIVALTA
jgi:hypothetical protein